VGYRDHSLLQRQTFHLQGSTLPLGFLPVRSLSPEEQGPRTPDQDLDNSQQLVHHHEILRVNISRKSSRYLLVNCGQYLRLLQLLQLLNLFCIPVINFSVFWADTGMYFLQLGKCNYLIRQYIYGFVRI
jgi:hypothetical protein